MSNHIDIGGDDLLPELRDAIDVLRESEEPTIEWRDRVLRATSGATENPRTHRVRTWMTIAAGLGGILIGGTSVYLAMRSPDASVVATAPLAVSKSPQVRVRFAYEAPTASTVTIVGDFNRWDPTTIPLRRSNDGGTWEIEIPLNPGRYAYAFYVDGKLARDPAAPQVRDNDFGTPNSVVMVKGS